MPGCRATRAASATVAGPRRPRSRGVAQALAVGVAAPLRRLRLHGTIVQGSGRGKARHGATRLRQQLLRLLALLHMGDAASVASTAQQQHALAASAKAGMSPRLQGSTCSQTTQGRGRQPLRPRGPGYRSGGFNLRQSTQLDNPATPLVNEEVKLLPFGAEKIWSYEVGAKMEFNRTFRLNAALFYNTYSDLQATIPIPISGGGSFGTQVVNAGKINYIGFEVEALARLNDVFSLDGSVGYVHKNVKEFPGTDTLGNTVNIASVVTPGNSPDWTASAGSMPSSPSAAMPRERCGWAGAMFRSR